MRFEDQRMLIGLAVDALQFCFEFFELLIGLSERLLEAVDFLIDLIAGELDFGRTYATRI